MDGTTFPTVLDPCCGSRMFWFDRADGRALFGDCRRETLEVKDTSHGRVEWEDVPSKDELRYFLDELKRAMEEGEA